MNLPRFAGRWKVRTLTPEGLSTNQLRLALAELFTAARQAVARRLEARGVPFVVLADRPIIERGQQGPGSWRSDTLERARNVLGVGLAARRAAPWLTATEVGRARECASQLATVSTTLPFWAPLGAIGWELVEAMDDGPSEFPESSDGPVDWVLRYIVLPALRWHLEALPSVSLEDDRRATAFANEVVQVTQDDRLRYRVLAPLSGINLAGTHNVVTEGGISIRRLSNEEQGEWFMEHQGPPAFSLLGTEPPQVLLEHRVSGPRNGQHLPAGGSIPLLVAALQLHGHEVASKAAIEYSQPRWVQSFAYPVAITLPQRSLALSTSELTAADFHAIVQTTQLLSHYDIAQPKTPHDLAFHRFVSGAARQNDVDAVLDFMIGLEGLLVPGSNPGDISYRFSIHGAHYFADDVSGRTLIRDQLRNIYRMRNNLVHGNRYPEQTAIAAARANAQDLLRRGLLRTTHEGFPTPETFAQMLLGTGTP
jgi:hypothetical protein